jgi:tetratricopeptide (TPR) repeat protein
MSERDLFEAALEVPPEKRAAYLDGVCGTDAALRQRLEALLWKHDQAGSFLENPAACDDPFITAEELLSESPGTVIGPYKLMEQLGEGGMGLVFVAEQQQPVRRKVALKVIKPGMDTRQIVARFEAERQALALMDHPNIATVLDGGTTASGRPYFVMELVKGLPITAFCDQNQVPVRQRLELFLSVCQAVQHAHQKGIIHRDIKPSNVLVMSQDGTPLVKVIDFGVAKAIGQQLTDKTVYTHFAQLIGTPLYMSPEQAGQSGLDVDTRSDIYSLGVLLYELLTGTTPFDKKRLREADYDEIRRIIREEEPPRPSTRISTLGEAATTASTNRKSDPKQLSRLIRGELDWIVMKALEKDRNRRYESASAFAADVQRYLHDEPVLACPPSAGYRFRKFARRNKGRLLVAAGVFLAVIVMATSIGWAVRDREAWAEESARQEKDRLAVVEGGASESWRAARADLAGNNLSAALRKVAEARAQLGQDRTTLGSWAAKIDLLQHDLDQFQQFVDLIERAHTAETISLVALPEDDNWHGDVATERPSKTWGRRRPAAAVPFLLSALQRFKVLERDDWNTALDGGLLGKDQVAQVRRQAYEELVWLADDMVRRQKDHRSGQTLSPEAAAKQALVYLDKAETAHRASQALYVLRGRCREAMGEKAAAQADAELAKKTPPTLARDHTLRGWAAFDAHQNPEAVQAFEAALHLDPTDYWSLMGLGYGALRLARTPEEVAGVSRIFTGCILKRPDHSQAYLCRGFTYSELGRYQEALADYSKAIELDPKSAEAWYNRGNIYGRMRQRDRAIADYSKAIKVDEKFAPAWNNRGGYFNQLGQPDKAVADYSQAIKLQPKNPFFLFNRAHVYDRLDKPAKAVEDYSKAIELDSKFISAWFARGEAYDKLGQHNKALADYNALVRLDPTDVTPYARFADHRLKRFWLDRGRANWILRRYKEAVADFSEAIKLDENFAPAWYNRGNAYADLGQLDKAVADCTHAIKLDAKDAIAWSNRGAAYLSLKEWDKALADLAEAIKLDKKLAAAWSNRGAAYFNLSEFDKALADLTEAIKLDETLALAWYNRGSILYKLNQLEKAINDLSQALKRDPRIALAWFYRGNARLRLGQLQKAIADFTEHLKLDQKEAKSWNSRGVAYMRLGRSDKAVADYSEALKLDPNDATVWFNRGIAYGNLGRADKAVADYSQALERDRKLAFAWYRRGVAYLDHLGRPDKAIADFTRFLELEHVPELAFYNRGVAFARLGQWDKAVADFSRHLKVDSKDANVWYNRGVGYLQLGQPDKAISDFSKAVGLNRNFASAWSNRGIAYDNLGRPEKAIADYSMAVKVNPKFTQAWYNRGVAYGKLGQPDKAVADYSQAIKLNERFSDAWCNRGIAYSKLGETDKAIADYSKALELDQRDGIALVNRGDAYSQLGKFAQARADYEKALKLPRASARLHNAMAWLLATCPDVKLRDPVRAVNLATRAAQLAPKVATSWTTLGAAHYRAGDWKAAVAALDQSMALRRGPDAITWLFLAMAHRKLANHDEARKCYDRAVQWLEKNEETLAKDKAQAEELRRFRSEAEEVLELKKR